MNNVDAAAPHEDPDGSLDGARGEADAQSDEDAAGEEEGGPPDPQAVQVPVSHEVTPFGSLIRGGSVASNPTIRRVMYDEYKGYFVGVGFNLYRVDSSTFQPVAENSPLNGLSVVGYNLDGDAYTLGESTWNKYDANGQLLWTKPIEAWLVYHFSVHNDQLVVSGITGGVPFVAKYGSDGALLWRSQLQRRAVDPAWSDLASVAGQIPYLQADAAGHVYAAFGLALVELDEAGNELWRTVLGYRDPGGEHAPQQPTGLVVTQDGSALFISGAAGLDTSATYLIRLDTSGAQQWTKILSYGGSYALNELRWMGSGVGGVYAHGDGLVIAGRYENRVLDSSNYYRDAYTRVFVSRISYDGEVQWFRQYGTVPILDRLTAAVFPIHLVAAPNGTLCIAAFESNVSAFSTLLFKVNGDGSTN